MRSWEIQFRANVGLRTSELVGKGMSNCEGYVSESLTSNCIPLPAVLISLIGLAVTCTLHVCRLSPMRLYGIMISLRTFGDTPNIFNDLFDPRFLNPFIGLTARVLWTCNLGNSSSALTSAGNLV